MTSSRVASCHVVSLEHDDRCGRKHDGPGDEQHDVEGFEPTLQRIVAAVPPERRQRTESLQTFNERGERVHEEGGDRCRRCDSRCERRCPVMVPARSAIAPKSKASKKAETVAAKSFGAAT